MFKKLSRNIEDIKKTQVKLLEMNNTVSEKKNTLDWINNRLNFHRRKD